MRKYLPFLLIFVFASAVFAQQHEIRSKGKFVIPTQPHPGQVNVYPAGNYAGQKAFSSTQIGTTWYDGQTTNYGNIMNRIYEFPDGTIGATWQASGENADPDRGTGYNYYNGTEWGTPNLHIGEDPRTGWPCYAPWGANGEIFCHYWYATASLPGPIKFFKRENKGEGDWIETELYGPEGLSLVWHSMVTSGENNEHIHLLAYTYDAEYMGQTNALVYYRSSDGAETWDIEGVIIDGLGENYFPTINALSYEWANPVGNTIAFGYGFREYGGYIFKSTDNGDNWEKTEVMTSPFDPLQTHTSTADFGGGVGSFDLVLDSQEKVHLVFPRMIGGFNDAGEWGYYPFTDGLIYWNEDMGRLDTTIISSYTMEFLEDGGYLCGWILANEPYTIDYTNQPDYANAACGFPQISIMEDDKIFISWSGLAPDFHTGGTPDLFYRHIAVNASFDGGNWWNGPKDINLDIQWLLSECVYSEMSPILHGDMVHIVFQEDNLVGTYEWPASVQTIPSLNRIHHMDFPVSFFVGVDELSENQNFEVSPIYPNPSNSTSRFGLRLQEKSNVSIDVVNVVGQAVKKIELGTLNTGTHPVELTVSDLKPGIYYVSITVDQRKTTQKILVQ